MDEKHDDEPHAMPSKSSRNRSLGVAFALIGAGLIGAFFLKEEEHPTRRVAKDAAPADTAPIPSSSAARNLADAGPQDAGPGEADIIDGGATACKTLFGPVELPFMGPAALSTTPEGVQVATHQNGALHITSFPLDASGAKRKDLPGAPTKASRPACAAAGDYVFCADNNGDVHRMAHDQGSEHAFVHTDAGSRISAASLPGGHVALAYLAVMQTTEGQVSEAFVRIDEQEPVRISDEGAGATDVVLAEHGDEVVVLYVDARLAMSPLHARTVSLEGSKAKLGSDEVVFVGGGSDHQVFIALASSSSGDLLGLMPTSNEDGFGMVTVKLGVPPTTDEPSEMSLYPNGINMAPIAATTGGKKMYVARVRPLAAEPTSPKIIELGAVTGGSKIAYAPYGVVASAGSVKDVAIAVDKNGSVWLHYTDQDGSWIEKRQCP